MVGQSSLQLKWQTLVNIWEISYSNLETGRYGPKSGVCQIIRKTCQYCVLVWSLPLWQQQAQHKPGKSKKSTDIYFTVTFKMSTDTISYPDKEQKNMWGKYVECPGKVE